MVKTHKFYLNDKYIVLDINSGAVHIVDNLVYELVDYFENSELEEVIEKLGDKYDSLSIKEAWNEIAQIKENGLLYSDPVETKEIVYNEDNIIKALCLHVAHDCNLKCNYCFASQGDFDGEKLMMNSDIGKKALDFLVENSGNRVNLEVDFFGGEPLMNFDVVKELVEYGEMIGKKHNKNFRFTITTNGILLDRDKMDYINEKMDNVVLSLDGRRDVHDAMRPTVSGKGSYDIIAPKFLEFTKLRGDKSYYIRGTFTSKNLDFAKDVMFLKKEGFDILSMEPVVAEPEMDYAILEGHLDIALKEYEILSKEYIDAHKSGDGFEFFHFMIDLTQGPCFVKRVVGCGAGSEYLAVTPDGDFYPCHQFVGNEDFKIGSVSEGINRKDIVSEFKKTNVMTKEACKECWAKYYCSGGCHANAYNFNKDINIPYEVGCEMERKRVECAISIKANMI